MRDCSGVCVVAPGRLRGFPGGMCGWGAMRAQGVWQRRGHAWQRRGACMAKGACMCSPVTGGGPFSINLPPQLVVSRNMVGI